MQVKETILPGVFIIEPNVFHDNRGYFLETFVSTRYASLGLPSVFVQDNLGYSVKNVVRGLHYQIEHPQGKLVFVTLGKVLDVIVDIRKGSPTFGQSITVELSHENGRQVYIPEGFAHGYCALSERADFYYKCTDYYYPQGERGIRWDDPDLQIPWPVKHPIMSPKDLIYPCLKEVDDQDLPVFIS